MVYIVLFGPVCLLWRYSRRKGEAKIDFHRSHSRSHHRSQITCQCGFFGVPVQNASRLNSPGHSGGSGSFISANTSPSRCHYLAPGTDVLFNKYRECRDVREEGLLASRLGGACVPPRCFCSAELKSTKCLCAGALINRIASNLLSHREKKASLSATSHSAHPP